MKKDKLLSDHTSDSWDFNNWISNNEKAIKNIYVKGFLLKHPDSDKVYLGYNPNLSHIFEVNQSDITEVIPLNQNIDFGGQTFSLVGVLLSNSALLKSIELFRSTKIPALIDFNNNHFNSDFPRTSVNSIAKGEQPDHDTRERGGDKPEPRSSERPAPERNNSGGGVRG
jgi:hypothetical protein